MEFTLLWAALTGVGFAWAGLRLWSEQTPPKSIDLILGAATIGLVIGRLAAMARQGINPFTDPFQIILVRGGVDTGFATIGALAALAWLLKGRLTGYDALAPAALFGLAGWHAGCIWRSACLGTASDLPWAWAQAGSTVTRHPVELYAAIGLALAAFAVSRLPWSPLLRSGVALLFAGLVRLMTEPLRHSLTGGPVEWYAAGIALGLLAVLAGRRLPSRLIAPT